MAEQQQQILPINLQMVQTEMFFKNLSDMIRSRSHSKLKFCFERNHRIIDLNYRSQQIKENMLTLSILSFSFECFKIILDYYNIKKTKPIINIPFERLFKDIYIDYLREFNKASQIFYGIDENILIIAINSSQVETLKFILYELKNFQIKDKKKPILMAIKMRNVEILKIILDFFESVKENNESQKFYLDEIKEKDYSLLRISYEFNALEIFQELVNRGINVNERFSKNDLSYDFMGFSMLEKKRDFVQVLANSKNYKINDECYNTLTPLMFSIFTKDFEIFKIIASNPNVDVNKFSDHGKSALLFSITDGFNEAAIHLLKNFNIEQRKDLGSGRFVDYFCLALQFNRKELIDYYVKNPCLDAKSLVCSTINGSAVFFMITENHFEVFKNLLIENRININIKGDDEMNHLFTMVFNKRIEFIKCSILYSREELETKNVIKSSIPRNNNKTLIDIAKLRECKEIEDLLNRYIGAYDNPYLMKTLKIELMNDKSFREDFASIVYTYVILFNDGYFKINRKRNDKANQIRFFELCKKINHDCISIICHFVFSSRKMYFTKNHFQKSLKYLIVYDLLKPKFK